MKSMDVIMQLFCWNKVKSVSSMRDSYSSSYNPNLMPYSVILIAPHKLMSMWLMSLERRIQRARLAVKRGRGEERQRERQLALL